MNRFKIITGGLYSDALPTGEFASLIIGADGQGSHLETHIGKVPMPVEEKPGLKLMFIRITNVGGFKIAAKSASTTGWTWEWTEASKKWRLVPKNAHGVQGLIYGPDGKLFVFETDGTDQDSQGIRYWGPTGPVYGSPTYNPVMPFAKQLGIRDLFEWSYFDGIAIGQGDQGDAVFQLGGKHYKLYGGNVHFIQFHKQGTKLSVAFPIFGAKLAVLCWLDVADITTLPEWTAPKPQTPGPSKPPQNPPSPPKQEPSVLPTENEAKAIVTEATKKYSTQKGRLRAYLIVNYVAWKLKQYGAGVYSKGKSGDGFDPPNDGVNEIISSDAIIFKPNWETFDCLGDAENRAKPAWDRTTPTGFGKQENWRAPVNPDLLAVLAGLPQPEPEPEAQPPVVVSVTAFSATATKDGRIVLNYTV